MLLADKLYQQNVTALAKIRDDWLKDHTSACEVKFNNDFLILTTFKHNKYWAKCQRFCFILPQVFENQSVERINFLRSTIWTHLNQLSQQCVTSDEVKLYILLAYKTVYFYLLYITVKHTKSTSRGYRPETFK